MRWKQHIFIMKNLDTVSHIVFQFHLLNHSGLSPEIAELPPED